MKKVAVILSGCGVFDGAEINETLLTLLTLEKTNIAYQCFAPDITQHHVINHLNGEEVNGVERNVLVEAARIVRGNVKALTECKSCDFDGLIVVGGFGVAKNLSDFAFAGSQLKIIPEALTLLKSFKGKPVGYMCIAPVLLPLIYGAGVKVTIGNDKETAQVIEQLGGVHVNCSVDDAVVDEDKKVVTTPAYMLARNLLEAEKGISCLVKKLANLR